ncbi:MAG: nuclear transport factor 2 family protein [Cyanobacteria bacterium SID2]|nr:nuclear transport factor 2 family protein [Cyanobacteria bacterium SID2]MBP0004671.1 nuclear transport factor 2 family protein [Cyanobacteria bacterium SBC]
MNASDVIQSLYDAINRRDIEAAIEYVDEACVYEDLNFPQPFQGKDAVRELFSESCQSVPDDLQFVIDEITTGDRNSVGVLWHVEIAGIPFPNGRGTSFYRLSETTGKLIFARDLVEPPLKPGKFSLYIIRFVTPLVRWLLKPPSEGSAKRYPGYAALLWGLTVAYVGLLLLSPPNVLLPGYPLWAIQPETIQELLGESLNFFFVLPILNALSANAIPSPIVHPVTEAFFNFAEVWILMFLPLMLADARGYRVPRVGVWGAAMFLTNIFLMPYMAVRSMTLPDKCQAVRKSLLARIFGWTGLVVGTLSIVWFCIGRPEFGTLTERLHYFVEKVTHDRVAIAFSTDLVLFGIFQAILIGSIEPIGSKFRGLRFLPFWGLAIWLVLPSEGEER